jgi:hypothetical protein
MTSSKHSGCLVTHADRDLHDIHGNLPALTSTSHTDASARIVVAPGDLVGYASSPTRSLI